jgi:hypothetical protein
MYYRALIWSGPLPWPVAPLVGSGAYRGVRGEVTSGKPGKGYDVDVLRLDA